MTTAETKELKVKEKQEVAAPAEQTKPGLVFTPSIDIFETDQEITMLADLPGVAPENLSIDLKDNTLTLTGDIDPFENADEQDVYIEYEVGKYYRQFALSEVIDQEKIDAHLADGVLKLILPKVKKATPRKITIKT
jgi:HSP20 family molecular chaperone IbpA